MSIRYQEALLILTGDHIFIFVISLILVRVEIFTLSLSEFLLTVEVIIDEGVLFKWVSATDNLRFQVVCSDDLLLRIFNDDALFGGGAGQEHFGSHL